MKLKTLAINILLLFFVSVLCLLCLEFGFRFVRPLAQSQDVSKVLIHEHTPDNLKMLYKPSAHAESVAYGVDNKINALGFRDYELSPVRDSSVERTVFLGDSVVYGYGLELEDTIPKNLEKALNEKGESAEVLNLGVSGYDTIQAVEFFKEVGLKLNPDRVILGYTLNDSIYASMELDFFHDKNDLQVKAPRKKIYKQAMQFLFKNSSIMQFLEQRYQLTTKHKMFRYYREKSIWHFIEDRNIRHKDALDSPYQMQRSQIEAAGEQLGTSPEGVKKHLGFLGIGNSDFWSSHWNLSYDAAKELSRLSRSHGFELVVVIFPYMVEVQAYPSASMHKYLTKEFESLGFRVIDLLDLAVEMDKKYGRDVINDPIHFSPLGSRLIAEKIAEKL